jgi:beta-glucosidase
MSNILANNKEVIQMSFPKDFVWGAATASYQIEGAAFEGKKGLSVWDNSCSVNGFVKDGHTGAIACDHYHIGLLNTLKL